jgi:hypothetical protein
VSPSANDPAEDLTLALTKTLRAAFDAFPQLVLDAEQLADRLAPGLADSLGAAAKSAGMPVSGLARGLGAPSRTSGPGPGIASTEERILFALNRHASGRTPGVTPDSLASLTGLAAEALGPAVSALVQSGDLVRDGWLVRLPQADDLLPSRRPEESERAGELRQASERRAVGDRRAVGERRLYDRRGLG